MPWFQEQWPGSTMSYGNVGPMLLSYRSLDPTVSKTGPYVHLPWRSRWSALNVRRYVRQRRPAPRRRVARRRVLGGI